MHSLGKLGIGISSVLIISRWLSANAMFTTSEITLTYGIIGGFLFGIMGTLAFYTYGYLGKVARTNYKEATSLINLFQEKVDDRTKHILLLLIGIGYTLDFLLLAMGASIILYATFHLPITIGILLFTVLGLPLLIFGFIKDIGKLAIYKLGILQIVIFIIFVYLFLTSDIKAMFLNMRLYHPYMFSINLEELLFLNISIFLIFFSKLLTDFGTWKILLQIRAEKIRQSFILSGSIWATIPLCFSIIIFPGLSLGGFQNSSTLFYDLLNLLGSPIFEIICAATLLATFWTTYFSRLSDFLHLINKQSMTNKKPAVALLLFVIIFLFGGYVIIRPSIIDLFFFTGVLNVALLMPVLFIIFAKQIKKKNNIRLMIMANVVAGYMYYLFFDQHLVVVMTVLTSLLLGFFFWGKWMRI